MSSGGWIRKFEKLKEELEHHMDEEEDEVFALAKRIFDDDDAATLAARFEQRKAEKK